MTNNEMNPATVTDSFKTLAVRYNMTPADVRATALDLDLAVRYSAARKTYYLAEDAHTVARFNRHLHDEINDL